MADVVVTVPMSFGWEDWLDEGDLPGEEWSGMESHFYLGGSPPQIQPGERVYVVSHGYVRGYAPLVRIAGFGYRHCRYALGRRGGAVAVTIPERVRGFRGFRYRWWDQAEEVPWPEWHRKDAVPPGVLEAITKARGEDDG